MMFTSINDIAIALSDGMDFKPSLPTSTAATSLDSPTTAATTATTKTAATITAATITAITT